MILNGLQFLRDAREQNDTFTSIDEACLAGEKNDDPTETENVSAKHAKSEMVVRSDKRKTGTKRCC